MTMHPAVDGRTGHYAEFYGVRELPGPEVLVVLGNCQSEALRLLISSGPEDPAIPPTVRIPPVFELTAADLPRLQRVLQRTRVLVAQPIRADYRGLPLGAEQLASQLPSASSVVRIPVLYDSGLFPWVVTLRHPSRPEEDPPVVPYHDLRTLAEAATELSGGPRAAARPPAVRLPLAPERIRHLAEQSLSRLLAREKAHGTVALAERLRHVTVPAFHTVNHPANEVLALLASAVRSQLGADPAVVLPRRTLLGEVLAPLEPQVLTALGLEGPSRAGWTVGGEPVTEAAVRAAQLEWYRANPVVVEAGIDRHRQLMADLGLGG
ncbi:WcbI family polysaccharide biosynthesis putative acetyltransferase [Citricoccus nitrophenolicus]|uniref:WcbI family polysaccharide biosynthesis putative acetyltransferase n=1 Tax=Citricoccus nitrophenolicus TaxID=863575 RepID=A0ABV0IFD3_9MICC